MTFLCSFTSVSHLRGKERTYKALRAAILAAGRFSVFDVVTAQDGRMFTQLCNDPNLEITLLGYPWTGVKEKVQAERDTLSTPGMRRW